MEVKRIPRLEGLNPQSTTTNSNKGVVGQGGGPSFLDTLNKLQQPQNNQSIGAVVGQNPASVQEGVKFSNHAIERMQSRGITYSPQDVSRLNEAIAKAAAKGSKDSLILMNDSALIVSVKNKTVVTVMDKNALKENVFTNIDSTIVM